MNTAASTTVTPERPAWPVRAVRGLAGRIARRWHQRWPEIRRVLPRDLLIVVWLALLAQAFGLAWVSTNSVGVKAAIVLKGAPVKPGELAVFLYQGGAVPDYYPPSPLPLFGWRRSTPADRAGPRKGTAFLKYLWGVPGDRVEVVQDEVFLTTRHGRFAMGRVKPRAKGGAPLTAIAPLVIPPGYVYMWAPHTDALDSRYALMGLVPISSIAGKAVRLW